MKVKSLDMEFSTKMPQIYMKEVSYIKRISISLFLFLYYCSYEVEREKKKEEEAIQLKYYSFLFLVNKLFSKNTLFT